MEEKHNALRRLNKYWMFDQLATQMIVFKYLSIRSAN